MLTEEIYKSMNDLTQEDGVLKVYLFDEQGNFLAEDSATKFSNKGKEYGREQISELLALGRQNHIVAEEIIFDLEEMRIFLHFLDTSALMILCSIEVNMTSLKLSVNSLLTEIRTNFSESSTHEEASAEQKVDFSSRSSSFDKASLPEVIQAVPDFIIFLKKLLNKFGAPQATSEVKEYFNKNKLNSNKLDSHSAYNLIIYLSNHVPDETRDFFTAEAQEVLKHYF